MSPCGTFFSVLTAALLFFLSMTSPSPASDMGVMAASTGASAAKPVVDTVSSVAEIPLAAAELVRLPLGVVQVGLAPLPGIGLLEGLENIGQGVLAPFKLVMGVLVLPYNIFNGIGGACNAVASGN